MTMQFFISVTDNNDDKEFVGTAGATINRNVFCLREVVVLFRDILVAAGFSYVTEVTATTEMGCKFSSTGAQDLCGTPDAEAVQAGPFMDIAQGIVAAEAEGSFDFESAGLMGSETAEWTEEDIAAFNGGSKPDPFEFQVSADEARTALSGILRNSPLDMAPRGVSLAYALDLATALALKGAGNLKPNAVAALVLILGPQVPPEGQEGADEFALYSRAHNALGDYYGLRFWDLVSVFTQQGGPLLDETAEWPLVDPYTQALQRAA